MHGQYIGIMTVSYYNIENYINSGGYEYLI